MIGLILIILIVTSIFCIIIAVKRFAPADANSSQALDPENRRDESQINYNLFEYVLENELEEKYILKYEYEENICLLDDIISKVSGNGGKEIDFMPEPDNQYDNNAIAIYLGGEKIGFVYKGRTQDMINDWIKRGDLFTGYINKIFVADKKATYKIGFYKPLNNYEYKRVSLIKTKKKIDDFSTRSENLECCTEGDVVIIEYDPEVSAHIVYDELYNEIGELSASVSASIGTSEDKKMAGLISEIDYETSRVKIDLYLID